jgi:DNA-binding transcriptional LysR family regulator
MLLTSAIPMLAALPANEAGTSAMTPRPPLLARNLYYFLIAGEEENLHRAAERLHVAQPALSRRMFDLEEELGVELFERVGRGIRLTDIGRVFLADVRQLVLVAEQARDRAQRAARGQVGKLRVGLNEAAARHRCVPQSFHVFRSRYPEVELDLVMQHSDAQLSLLREGKLDAGFVYHRPRESAELSYLELDEEDVVVAVPALHPLAHEDELDPRALADENFIWIRRELGRAFYDRLMAGCIKAGLVPKIVQEVENADTVLALVSAGMGLGVVHSGARGRWSEGVVFKPMTGLSVPMRLELVWRADDESPLLTHFSSVVKKVFSGSHEGERNAG